MKRKILIVLGIVYIAFIVEFIFHFSSDSDSHLSETDKKTEIAPKVVSTEPTAIKQSNPPMISNQIEHQGKSQTLQSLPQQQQLPDEPGPSESNSTQATGYGSTEYSQEEPMASIEEIKRKIYDLRIEYTEDLEALEEIVQTGDADQSSFWEGDWASVDDWKRRDDSFQLKINDNGSFTFITADGIHQPSHSFTFDEEKREFYWEEDYYGKIISHRAKFVNPGTLLIIKTSGVKVNLDIYEKAAQ